MSTPSKEEDLYRGMRVVGDYGWYHYDGKQLLSWGHPRASSAQLLFLFNGPGNLPEQQREAWRKTAEATLTWDFVAGQMRLYDIWFSSTMQKQPILNTLRNHAQLGDCKTVPKRIRNIEKKLRAEWMKKFGNVAQQAPMDQIPMTQTPQPMANGTPAPSVDALIAPESECESANTDPGCAGGTNMDSEEDEEPIFHTVLPGQGLAASRWHDPASDIIIAHSESAMEIKSATTIPDIGSVPMAEQSPKTTLEVMKPEEISTTTDLANHFANLEVHTNETVAIAADEEEDLCVVHKVPSTRGLAASRLNTPVSGPSAPFKGLAASRHNPNRR